MYESGKFDFLPGSTGGDPSFSWSCRHRLSFSRTRTSYRDPARKRTRRPVATMVNRGHTEILTSRDTDRWRQVLEEIGAYCFYHLPGFHRLEEMCRRGWRRRESLAANEQKGPLACCRLRCYIARRANVAQG